MFGEDEIVKSHKRRADIILNIVFASFAIILARLWYLQIYQGQILYQYSLENRLRKETVKAPRGMVFSSNNQLLIHNVPRFDAIATPQYMGNKKETIKKLSEILDIKVKDIKKTFKKNSTQASYRPIVIKKNISRKEVAIIETESSKMPGVAVRTFISREYADREIGSHLLGYISEISQRQLPKLKERDQYNYKLGDFIGKAGIEERFDLFLRGQDGHQFMEVDARGRMKRVIAGDNIFKGIKNKPAMPGNNLRLTVDRDLQKSAYNALEGKVGSAVVVDVKTGGLLALVSRPSFSPGKFSRGLTADYWSTLINDEKNPLLNRTIQEHYAPGSTFKLITAIAALEEGLIDERTEVVCGGSFRLGRRTSHCWARYGHGKVNLIRSIRESCDVYYYKIATRLDIDVLAKYARMFGLGFKTGISLPREITGLIPTKDWKLKKTGREWQKGETLSCVIGQSYVLTTPLQLAMFMSSIANDGILYKPYIVKEIFSNDGEVLEKFKPEKVGEIKISEKTLKLIKQGVYEVVNHRTKGTARGSRGRGIMMAGKTGTSQVIRFSADKIFSKCMDNEYKYRHHGIFVAYAPADDPQIAISVVIEHGCSGASAAAPVAKKIATTYMKKYLPEKSKNIASQELKEIRRILKKRKEAKERAQNENI